MADEDAEKESDESTSRPMRKAKRRMSSKSDTCPEAEASTSAGPSSLLAGDSVANEQKKNDGEETVAATDAETVDVTDNSEKMDTSETSRVSITPSKLRNLFLDKTPQGLDTKGKPEEIVISDDESDLPPRKRNLNCVNPDCKSLEDAALVSAPSYVVAYYGQKCRRRFKNGRAPVQVCEVCCERVSIVHEDMIEALKKNESIFDVDYHKPNEMVVLSDSDSEEEVEDVNEYLPGTVIDILGDKLKGVIKGMFTKYKMDAQLQKEQDSILEAIQSLTVDCKETLAIQADTQLDKLRTDLYGQYAVQGRALNAVEIVDLIGPDPQFHELQNQPKLSGVAIKRVTQAMRPNSTITTQENIVSLHSPIDTAATAGGEVVALEQVKVINSKLPSIGPIRRPPLKVGDVVYGMRFSLFSVWTVGTIVEATPKFPPTMMPPVDHTSYKIRFGSGRKVITKQLFGRQLAYDNVWNVRFSVGTRVIAVFKDSEQSGEAYYAGVIAEPPKPINHHRYLIFFDDGYTQYVNHEKVRLVCEASRDTSQDVHEDSKTFIKNYLAQYPERPMVRVALGQVIKTEWNGKWWLAKVIELDCSLCNMNFLADARTEWLYRGSTRLAPLYKELARINPDMDSQSSATRHRGAGIATLKKANMPYVEYTVAAENESDTPVDKPSRAVAKKSTTKRPVIMPVPVTRRQHALPQVEGRIKFDVYNLKDYESPLRFVPHQCGPPCAQRVPYTPDLMKHCGPLAVPLLLGWRREIVRFRGKKVVLYKAPCGRRIRKMEELARYLRFTKCDIGLDYFDFNFFVNCLTEFKMLRQLAQIQDLSYGAEYMPVPCVNTLDHLLPEFVKYDPKREPVEGVKLNINPEFLTGCDCKDGCQDRDKCACWQLTFAGTIFTSGKTGVPDNSIGYRFKRLTEPVLTGIYECNSRCGCSSTCSNRVVQNPLRCKLQVFRTENRGWGIRAMNDMPQGSFICIYAGRLLNEHEANEGGKNQGDEYLAELDYIEVVERLKEGYEAQVEDIFGRRSDNGSSSEESSNDTDVNKQLVTKKCETEDEDFKPAESQEEEDIDSEMSAINTRSKRKLRAKKGGKKGPKLGSFDNEDSGSKDSDCVTVSDVDDEQTQRRPQRFAPAEQLEPMDLEEERPLSFPSIRTYFGEPDMCYIMDAKTRGNIGRYLNHSCNPNVFVQNVFVDTHDLRFPWVAFFALSYIQAGTELTWDYNYDIGSVKDKVLYCKCGSADCRGRLL